MTIVNILRSFFERGRAIVMIDKLRLRFFDKRSTIDFEKNIEWCLKNETKISKICRKIDPDLWDSIQETLIRIQNDASDQVKWLNVELGGGGAIPLIYFLVRFIKPNVVVETGVAAGYSSYAILLALHENRNGMLYSSDFPYFRLADPESYIGIVVPDRLKTRWKLLVEGDRTNIAHIMDEVDRIDLIHYDSDKSYLGRQRTIKKLASKMHENTWLIMDDIQDNSFFYDLVRDRKADSDFFVFAFEGKWVGILHPNGI